VDHVRPWSTVDRSGAAESVVALLPEHGAQALRLARGCHEQRRRERGTQRCWGALTGDGAMVKRPGDGGKAVVMKAHGGDELQHERGLKKGGVGRGETRRGPGAFYRCQGGAGWPDGGGEWPAVVEHHDGGGGSRF
jgi:hypothetical protein